MKITKDQIKNMKSEDIEIMIKDAIEKGDKEFIINIIPLLDFYNFELVGVFEQIPTNCFISYFESNNDLIKDRDIVMTLVKYGFDVPKELYGDDEEILLLAAKEGWLGHGFELASDERLRDKEFAKKMFSRVTDDRLLDDFRSDYVDNLYFDGFLEYDEINQLIEAREQELKDRGVESLERLIGEKDKEIAKLKETINEKNIQITKLQEMLSTVLSFADKVRNSAVGKFFFRKDIKALPSGKADLEK